MKYIKKTHIYYLKIFYSRINKSNDYIKQILIYNIRNINFYIINVILKRKKILKIKNFLIKKKIFISHFLKIIELFK